MCSQWLKFFVFVVMFVVLFCLTCAAPVRLKREYINEAVHHYLMKYGYMSKNVEGAGALRTEESVRDAIKEMQSFGGLPVTGIVDAKTAKLMSTPRCGVPDVMPDSGRRKKRFSLQGQKWPYTNLTWSLRSRNMADLNPYDVRVVLSKALEVWSKHSRLTFTEMDSDRADILVHFYRRAHGDSFNFDGKGQILAHAYFPGSGLGGDAHFDEDEIWLTREDEVQDEGTSLFHVAAHEFGHSLGLQHSSVEGALMYPWYQGMQNGFNYELPEDDRLAIQTLYGSHMDRHWDVKPVYNPRPTYPTTPTTPRTRPTRPPERPRYHPPHPTKPYPRKPMHPDRKHYPNRHPHQHYPLSPDKYPWKYPEKTTTTTTTTTTIRSTEVYKERTHFKPHKGKEYPKKRAPDTCDTSYDAVAVIRREVFIFKDAYFWRIGDHGLLAGYPVEITRMWNGLPKNFTHVDSVYERPDNKIVFFVGRMYYVYTGNALERGYPQSLTSLGLPDYLDKIDGATIWGHNGKTFFFSGNRYWRYDEESRQVELDYPRSMDMWSGVGSDIDAVFQWKDGKTYFFKGKGFWKFDDLHMRVESREQILSGPVWMGCTSNIEGHQPGFEAPFTGDRSYDNSCSNLGYSVTSLLLIIAVSFFNTRI